MHCNVLWLHCCPDCGYLWASSNERSECQCGTRTESFDFIIEHVHPQEHDCPMKPERYSFSLNTMGDHAVVSMDCGGGVIRSRIMPVAVLRLMMQLCQRIRTEVINVALADEELMQRVPTFPECVAVGRASLGNMCDVSVIAHRVDDSVEFCTAFYDCDGDSAPALLLIEEQLEEFAERALALVEEMEQ